jgi:hypothetical protein
MIDLSEIKSEMDEGPTTEKRFTNAMRKILAVPREEILRREAEYKKQSLINPNRRGPKVKAKR